MTTSTSTAPSKDGWFVSHDLPVVFAAIVLLAVGYFVHGSMTAPKQATFSRHGLTFTYPAGWFPKDPDPEAFPVVVSFASVDDAQTRLDARISKKPPVDGPIEIVLDLARSTKHGELYKELASGPRRVAGRDWVRSEYTYAYKLNELDAPRIGFAVEYAAVNNENLYVVTLHGPEAHVRRQEGSILGSVQLK